MGEVIYHKFSRFSIADGFTLDSYHPFTSMHEFWVGFESYEVGNFVCPYDDVPGVKAWAAGIEAADRIQKRRDNCLTCS